MAQVRVGRGTAVSGQLAATFTSLRHANFRSFFVGQAISSIGNWVQIVAQTLLVLQLTDSAAAIGAVTAFQFGPVLLLGLWAGVLIDRCDRLMLLIVTNAAMLTTAILLGVVVLLGTAQLSLVYGTALLLGMANSIESPTRRTIINELVPRADVPNAVGLSSTLATIARLTGPALAGGLVATVGVGWCFIANGLSFVAPIVAVVRMDRSKMLAGAVIDRGGGQIRAGLRHAWHNHDLRLSLCLIAAVGVLGFNFLVHLPVLANEQLGGSGAYTLLTSAFGLGSVFGAVHLARQRAIDVGMLVRHTALLTAAVVSLAAAPGIALAAAAAIVAGFSSMGLLSGANTIAALAGDADMRGRVLGLFTVIVVGSIPVSGPLVGGLSEAIGIRMALLLSALATGVTALAVHIASRRAPAPAWVVTDPAAGLTAAAIHDDDTLRL